MDKALKKDAEDVFSEIGLDMPTAVRMFFKAVVREKRIPFELSAGNAIIRGKTADPDMSGVQIILPDEKMAQNMLYGFQCEGYGTDMSRDADGWRIRIGAKTDADG